MDFFITNPEYSILIGTIFAFLSWFSYSKGVDAYFFSITLVLWIIYYIWEISLVGSGMNIRIDLFLIYPILFIVSIASIVHYCLLLEKLKK